jgi:hypothetical protein
VFDMAEDSLPVGRIVTSGDDAQHLGLTGVPAKHYRMPCSP